MSIEQPSFVAQQQRLDLSQIHEGTGNRQHSQAFRLCFNLLCLGNMCFCEPLQLVRAQQAAECRALRLELRCPLRSRRTRIRTDSHLWLIASPRNQKRLLQARQEHSLGNDTNYVLLLKPGERAAHRFEFQTEKVSDILTPHR